MFLLIVHKLLDSLTISAFADDIVVIGKSMNAAQELVMMVTSLLQNIGLQLNVQKSASINIHKGKLLEKDLFLHHDSYIKAIGPEDTIKYLGITFNDELQFNSEELIVSLRQDLELLVSTPMLRPDQKLNIVNQYIWPKLIYPLQMAPLHKLSRSFLEDVDKILRSSVKEMLFLPADIPNSMLYASKKLKGLQLIRASWEAFLQHCNICLSLIRADNPHVNMMRQMSNSNRRVIPSAFLFPKTLLKLQFEIFEKNCEVVNMNHGRPFQDGEKVLRCIAK